MNERFNEWIHDIIKTCNFHEQISEINQKYRGYLSRQVVFRST